MRGYPIETGREVLSKCGRDGGRRFIITEVIDDDFVLVADGSTHKLIKPKKKRVKHLKALKGLSGFIKSRIDNGEPIEDYMLRNELELLSETCKEVN